MSQQRIGWWGLSLAVTGVMLLFAPVLIMSFALTLLEPWTGSDPALMTTAGYCVLVVNWLLGLILLLATLCFGLRSRGTWLGMSSLILSANILLGIGGYVGWAFFGLFH